MQTEFTHLSLRQEPTNPRAVTPAGWRASALLFGLPAVFTAASFYIFRPFLDRQGYSELESYLASLCVAVALLFGAALIAYQKGEGRPMNRAAFAARMRYTRPGRREAIWTVGMLVVAVLGYGLFSQAGLALVRAGIVPLPAGLPALADPNAVFAQSTLDQAAGGQLRGQWQIVILFAVTYFFNIVGEELWWRGYILPRQELAFGRFTWLVHGVMWAFFHAFKYWDILGLLPVCLVIAYGSQRLKNHWPGLIVHALINISGPLLITILVAGG